MNREKLFKLYVTEEKSIPDISDELNVSRSKVRYWLTKYQFIRSREDGIRAVRHKLGKHRVGKKFKFSNSHKQNLSKAKRIFDEQSAKGYRINSNGYYEFTRGDYCGKLVHVHIMEGLKGRPLKPGEVVHHNDENKLNNSPENLKLMTKSKHSSHHAKKDYQNRNINKKGQFT